MRTRHRVPSIFNLSMVDVLCCALGCVILLWLLNLREARQRAEEIGRTEQQLTETNRELAVAVQERDNLRHRLDAATLQLADNARQWTGTRKRLAAAEDDARATATMLVRTRSERDAAKALAAGLDRSLTALQSQKKDIEDRLTRQLRDGAAMEKQLTATVQRVLTLESQVKETESMADASSKRADRLASKLTEAEERARKLQLLADLVPSLRNEAKSSREKLATEEALAKGLETEIGERLREQALTSKRLKDLEAAKRLLEQNLSGRERELLALREDRKRLSADVSDANSRNAGLQNDTKALRAETERLRASVDNRFAGISLTGRRVLFLVDMSGSMELVDEQTKAPDKWIGVRETLAKILRSLPEVEAFQVIVFAEQPYSLLGEEGRWIRYDAKNSVDQAVAALTRIKPKGGTNMYSAMDAAFRYRDQGLDTIYFLSDGLPNMGEGLPPNTPANLSETEKGELLGKYIRRMLKSTWNRPQGGKPPVRINTVGFFYESPDVGAFLWALARENDGSFVGMSKP